MKALVTGSSGHLGEALCLRLSAQGHDVVGIDRLPGEATTHQGSIADAHVARTAMDGVDAVFHAATLHKPHVATHDEQAFIDVNLTGTLNVLKAAAGAGVRAFVFTSTTSVFGDALTPAPGAPAAWIDEDVAPRPKNIYGVTKAAAEDLCALFARNHKLPVVVLRTARFFPEADDDERRAAAYPDANLKLNEFLHRRVAIEDAVDAHVLAAAKAPALGFARYVISATTPFGREDLPELARDAPETLRRKLREFEAVYARLGWRMLPTLDRVYVNARARADLAWTPRDDFASVLARVKNGGSVLGPLAAHVGLKGYHRAATP